jgi:hypothetical protein
MSSAHIDTQHLAGALGGAQPVGLKGGHRLQLGVKIGAHGRSVGQWLLYGKGPDSPTKNHKTPPGVKLAVFPSHRRCQRRQKTCHS